MPGLDRCLPPPCTPRSAVITAICIAMSASWRLGLVILAAFPLLVLGAVSEFRATAWIAVGSGAALERAADVASEAVAAIRTVTAFNLQGRTLDSFSARLSGTVTSAVRQGAISGAGRGFSQFMTLSSYSLAFWAGAIFIQAGTMGRQDLLRCFLAVTLTAQAIGRITSLAPDSGKATAAARNVFKVLALRDGAKPAGGGDKPTPTGDAAKPAAGVSVVTAAVSAIDPLDASQGRRGVAEGSGDAIHGRIEFRDVT